MSDWHVARLEGWHFSGLMEIPDIKNMILLPAVNPQRMVSISLGEPAVLQRRFRLTSKLQFGGLLSVADRETIRRGAQADLWYEEEGKCQMAPKTCPCPTCAEGWTRPGEELPWGTHR